MKTTSTEEEEDTGAEKNTLKEPAKEFIDTKEGK